MGSRKRLVFPDSQAIVKSDNVSRNIPSVRVVCRPEMFKPGCIKPSEKNEK